MKNWRELLLGPAYFNHRAKIKASYAWSRKEISQFLAKQRYRYQATGLDAVCSKQDIMHNPKHYETTRFLTMEATTGGTTGKPFRFRMGVFSRRQKERAYIFDIWESVGYEPFDLRVVIRGNVSHRLIRYNVFENAYFISPSFLSPKNKQKVREFLHGLKPFFLHCYPSSLLQFIHYIGEDDFAQFKILGIMAGSEAFPKQQMEWIRKRFDTTIAHWYGHSEYAVLAKYCHSCNGFHFYPTYGLTEFEKDQKSGLNRIIATSYNHIGTKFVRYDTEDLSIINNKKCDKCAFPRVESIVGRKQEYFIDKFGQRQAFGPFLFGIHGEFWTKIQDIQFMQDSLGKIEVFIVGCGSESRIWIEKYISRRFALVDLSFHYVDIIEKTNHMKHKYYINNIGSSE